MKVVFHFGPPKSGTSAIQKWLLSNRDWLLSQHIYYPDHVLDVNGVSSGNLRAAFDFVNEDFYFSKELFDEQVNNALIAGCHTIVFSSEFFFRRLEEISLNVPNALFIGYIRFGLEVLQSSYNQSVKRHGKVEKFEPLAQVQSTLRTLSLTVKQLGEGKFELRPYCKKLFKNNSIVADFLDFLNLEFNSVDFDVGRVNPSYSLESIEVKRWFNQLEVGALETQLDLALQNYGDPRPYSLMSDQLFDECKIIYIRQLKDFLRSHDVLKSSEFYKECSWLKNNPYKEQELSLSEFESVLRDLLERKEISRHAVHAAYMEGMKQRLHLEYPERLEILHRIAPPWRVLFERIAKFLM